MKDIWFCWNCKIIKEPEGFGERLVVVAGCHDEIISFTVFDFLSDAILIDGIVDQFALITPCAEVNHARVD